MRGHDIEEFNEIIERHGLWRYDLHQTAKAIQPHLPLNGVYEGPGRKGQVRAVDLGGEVTGVKVEEKPGGGRRTTIDIRAGDEG